MNCGAFQRGFDLDAEQGVNAALAQSAMNRKRGDIILRNHAQGVVHDGVNLVVFQQFGRAQVDHILHCGGGGAGIVLVGTRKRDGVECIDAGNFHGGILYDVAACAGVVKLSALGGCRELCKLGAMKVVCISDGSGPHTLKALALLVWARA
ncbi:hypothetical protein KL86DES1_21246 [uncultured Desulfovibrio sp.]|uniref:Uncharacterized protein n=1 Tax=uncultured Desulfovibrio sp. TaxID=167968 RepID=A0A212L723_9BACT|nr:hypothetical protein KL86DES1_21246 [uncultured Desulfovibrio sp.]VZH34141.1 conserved protein of unknown function [Desulfovibrio sp. 86]